MRSIQHQQNSKLSRTVEGSMSTSWIIACLIENTRPGSKAILALSLVRTFMAPKRRCIPTQALSTSKSSLTAKKVLLESTLIAVTALRVWSSDLRIVTPTRRSVTYTRNTGLSQARWSLYIPGSGKVLSKDGRTAAVLPSRAEIWSRIHVRAYLRLENTSLHERDMAIRNCRLEQRVAAQRSILEQYDRAWEHSSESRTRCRHHPTNKYCSMF